MSLNYNKQQRGNTLIGLIQCFLLPFEKEIHELTCVEEPLLTKSIFGQWNNIMVPVSFHSDGESIYMTALCIT